MTLRIKLLLVALCTLALPWLGWLYLRQMDELLRHAQEQALTASARAMARSLTRTESLPASGAGWYVQPAGQAIDVDGYGDDWSALSPWAQAFPGHGTVMLASFSGEDYLLANIADTTRARGAPGVALDQVDYLAIQLGGAWGMCRYRFASAAPGAVQAKPQRGSAPECADPLRAQWQEDGSGYRLELRLPTITFDQFGIAAHDGQSGNATQLHVLPVWRPSAALSAALAQLAPTATRVRLLNGQAWLLADAGALSPAASSGHRPGRWSLLAYRGLIAHGLNGSPELAQMNPRSDATEIWQALSGVPAVSWRSNGSDGAVVLTAAVPLQGVGDPRGAVVLEQVSRSMPLLANRGMLWMLFGTLLTLLLAGALLFIFAIRLGARIRRLRDAAERALALDGQELGTQAFPLLEQRDELGDLARSFARLLQSVGGYTDYLRSLASKLSHELNTPLAIVRSSLENLESTGVPVASQAYLQRARDGSERLAALVRAMGSASRVERAIASAEAEDFDVGLLLAACVEGYRPLLGARQLEYSPPSSALGLHGAPDLLVQALDKLFDNALSFTPADGWMRLHVRAAAGGDGVIIELANQGPPLPQSMHGRLFDSLVSLRAAKASDAAPHLGLGLYIVRLIATRFGGEARARNLDDGSGVLFSLHLHGMPRQRLG